MIKLTDTQLCILQIVVAIGAVNWGLQAYNRSYNVVEMIFTDKEMQNYAYYAIALAGLVLIYNCLKQLSVL